jgi:hypothetical protein
VAGNSYDARYAYPTFGPLAAGAALGAWGIATRLRQEKVRRRPKGYGAAAIATMSAAIGAMMRPVLPPNASPGNGGRRFRRTWSLFRRAVQAFECPQGDDRPGGAGGGVACPPASGAGGVMGDDPAVSTVLTLSLYAAFALEA